MAIVIDAEFSVIVPSPYDTMYVHVFIHILAIVILTPLISNDESIMTFQRKSTLFSKDIDVLICTISAYSKINRDT